MDNVNFKICTVCHSVWDNRHNFLNDPSISYQGYQADFSQLKEDLFLFQHDCGNTLAIAVELFRDMYTGPVFKEKDTGTAEYPEHCLHKDNELPCPSQCSCDYVWGIIPLIKNFTTRR